MRIKVLLCIPMVLMLAAGASAQCRVEGVARSADGTPMAGATVRLEGSEYRRPLTTVTDADGRYAFPDVKAGTRVSIVAVQAGRPVAQAFPLVTLLVETVDLKVPLVSEAASADDVIAEEGPSGEVAGIVVSSDGRPVMAARIRIGETSLTASTDSAGRYLFGKLRPGLNIQLQASAAGFEPTSRDVVVPSGGRVGADFSLAAAARSEPSAAELPALDISADGGRFVARSEQVAAIPSVARKDIFRALQFLPGVMGSPGIRDNLSVRGGTPDQTLVTLDGLTLYQIPDVFGTFNSVDMDAVQSGVFSRDPFDAAAGGRLGGSLRLSSPSNATGKATGFVDVSMLGVGAFVSVPLSDRGSLLIATRQSPPTSLYNDALDAFATQSGVSVRDRIPRFSGGTFQTAPSTSLFRDANSRLDLKVSSRDRLSLSLYGGRDDVNHSHDLAVPTATGPLDAVTGPPLLPSDAVVQVSDVDNGTTRGLTGAWTRQWSTSASTAISIGRSEYSRSTDRAWLLTSPSTGQDYSFEAARGGSAASSDSNHVKDTTLHVDNSLGFGFAHSLSVGGEVSSFDIDYAFQTEGFQTGSSGAFASRLTGLLTQTGSGRLIAAYAQDAWRPSARLTLSPGVRVAHYDLASSSFFEPRIRASYELTPIIRLKAGWSIDHQVVNQITREDRTHGDGVFWALADGASVLVPRAQQVVAGGSINVQGLLFDLEGYYKALDDLTMFAPRLYPGIAPNAGSTVFFHGSGRAKGLEALLQKKSDANTFLVTYTLSRVENTYPALEAGPFPASNDQTSEFKVTDTVRIGAKWSVTEAWVFGSGRPYTPANGVGTVWFPNGATVTQITFDAKNSARLPEYHRLDVSTERDFQVRGMRMALGATLFNVYNRRNTWLYDYDTPGGSPTTNEVTLMGRAVNAFVRVGF